MTANTDALNAKISPQCPNTFSFSKGPLPASSTPCLCPVRTGVTDETDHYPLEANLPGFEKKDISDMDADKIKVNYIDGASHLTLPQQKKRLPEDRHLEIE